MSAQPGKLIRRRRSRYQGPSHRPRPLRQKPSFLILDHQPARHRLIAPRDARYGTAVDECLFSAIRLEASSSTSLARRWSTSALLRVPDRRDHLRCVLTVEPPPAESLLWDQPNVVVTLHAWSGGLGRHRRNALSFARNLEAFLAGERLENEISVTDLTAIEGVSAPAQFQ